ncbi:MAG: hypothetical protein ABIZ80_23450 [Bryobacteraceae bacterium]
MIAGAVPKPRDIFQNARILLVPSVWEEPSVRVAAEALVNGIPPRSSAIAAVSAEAAMAPASFCRGPRTSR